MTNPETPNVCEGCPASHLLALDLAKLEATQDQSFSKDLVTADMEGAAVALNAAAASIACNALRKKLPKQRDSIVNANPISKIMYVRKCPAFKPSMKIRLEQKGADDATIQEYVQELES